MADEEHHEAQGEDGDSELPHPDRRGVVGRRDTFAGEERTWGRQGKNADRECDGGAQGEKGRATEDHPPMVNPRAGWLNYLER